MKPFKIFEKDTKVTFIKFFRRLLAREEPDLIAAEGSFCSLCGMKGITDISAGEVESDDWKVDEVIKGLLSGV